METGSLHSISADVFLDLSDNRVPVSFWSDFIAGSVAGNYSHIVTMTHGYVFRIDILKENGQISIKLGNNNSSSSSNFL